MTINKDSSNKKDKPNDTSELDVQAYLLIKDKDTGKVIVSKRG